MDNPNENRGSSSTQKVVNDENRKPEPKAKRNIMLRQFQAFQAGVKPPPGQYAYTPRSFFFYGSLTDPLKLQGVQHLQMLKYYETEVYSLAGIRIEIDGKTVSGRTFEWADDDLSALTEGTWSLEEWKKEVEEEAASHFRPIED